MNFTEATLGQSSAPQAASISNTTSSTASGLNIAVSPPFSVSENLCGSTLASGSNCTVDIVFTPTANEVVTGTLTVSSSGFPTAATAVLVGTGGAAGSLQTQPASLMFATTGIGAKSTAQTVK